MTPGHFRLGADDSRSFYPRKNGINERFQDLNFWMPFFVLKLVLLKHLVVLTKTYRFVVVLILIIREIITG